jgi:hypothetical protein
MQKSGSNGTVSDTIIPMQEAFALCNKVHLEVGSSFVFCLLTSLLTRLPSLSSSIGNKRKVDGILGQDFQLRELLISA